MKKHYFQKRKTFLYIFALITISALIPLTTNINHKTKNEDSDYLIYKQEYELTKSFLTLDELSSYRWNPAYKLISSFFSATGLAFSSFIFICSLFIAISYYLLATQALKNPAAAFFATTLFIISPFLNSFSTIVLRQGISTAFLFLFIFLYSKNKKPQAIAAALISASLHWSGIFFILAALITRRLANTNTLIFITATLITAVVYFLNIPLIVSDVFLNLAKQHSVLDNYLSIAKIDYQTGFKPSFLLVSTLITTATIPLAFKTSKNLDLYHWLTRYFCFISISYFLISWIPYYDRVAILSWSIGPILILGLVERFRLTKKTTPKPRNQSRQ